MLRLPHVLMGRKVLLESLKCLWVPFHSPPHLQGSQSGAGNRLCHTVFQRMTALPAGLVHVPSTEGQAQGGCWDACLHAQGRLAQGSPCDQV